MSEINSCNLFLIDAIDINNGASVISLYKQRLQYYNDCQDTSFCDEIAQNENDYYKFVIDNSHYADSLKLFLTQLEEFLKWIEHINNDHPIILWISIHGCDDIKDHRKFPINKEDYLFLAAQARIKDREKRSDDNDDEEDEFIRDVVFPDGKAYYLEDLFEPIINKTPKRIVLLMSGCYQGLPKINRIFCDPTYGPDLIFAPIDWIDSNALDKAVMSVIAFIEENPDIPNFHAINLHPTGDQIEIHRKKLKEVITNIHITARKTTVNHQNRAFYRVWYRVNNSKIRERYPEGLRIDEVMD